MSADLSVLIQRGGVFDNVEGSTPEEIYKFVTDNMKAPFSLDSQTIYDALCSREKIMSTAVGNGFIIYIFNIARFLYKCNIEFLLLELISILSKFTGAILCTLCTF